MLPNNEKVYKTSTKQNKKQRQQDYNRSDYKMLCGQLSPNITTTNESMEHIKKMIAILKSQIESIHGNKLDILNPVAYRIQLVCGIFYFVKCHIGQDQYLHIKIFEPLICYGNKPNLIKIEPNIKSLQDPIDYF